MRTRAMVWKTEEVERRLVARCVCASHAKVASTLDVRTWQQRLAAEPALVLHMTPEATTAVNVAAGFSTPEWDSAVHSLLTPRGAEEPTEWWETLEASLEHSVTTEADTLQRFAFLVDDMVVAMKLAPLNVAASALVGKVVYGNMVVVPVPHQIRRPVAAAREATSPPL